MLFWEIVISAAVQGGGPPGAPPTPAFLLMETGDHLLLESGDSILLE